MAKFYATSVFKTVCLVFLLATGALTLSWQDKSAEARTSKQNSGQSQNLEGAWRLTNTAGEKDSRLAGATGIRMAQDGFFTVAYYRLADKKFIGTYGGTYRLENGKVQETIEFHTLDSTKVGSSQLLTALLKAQTMTLKAEAGSQTQTWERLPAPATPLTGAWRISGRMGPDGKFNEMPLRARRTIKILSGNRFQWIAYNLDTKEFMGTGGGTYTAQNGNYVEHLEFFSRDNSRVGQILTFHFEMENGKWHYTGLSSTGNPINEYWQRHTVK